MPIDLLIINPHSPEFYYIPMGTFAIAAFLEDSGYRVRIVNLAHVPAHGVLAELDRLIVREKPQMFGVILHWKETLTAFLSITNHLHRRYGGTPVVAGGITAGFYARDILTRLPFLTGVVAGDAEIPLLELCRGTSPDRVPNLFFLDAGSVREPEITWTADGTFIDELHYGRIDLLEDCSTYLQFIDTRLGLPLAPGRGCSLDCGYCGGSRKAFELHSHRSSLALRSPERIVDDLEQALSCGANNFLLSHLPSVCNRILAKTVDRFGSSPPFSLNLEIWGEPSQSLLESYTSIRWPMSERGRYLLLTLHGGSTAAARIEERKSVIAAAEFALSRDQELLATIFSGYYSPWHQTAKGLDEELSFSWSIRRNERTGRISYALMAFSTDPASQWSRNGDGIRSGLSLTEIASHILDDRSVTNNLLLHRPVQLAPADELSFQAAWHVDNLLFSCFPKGWRLIAAMVLFEDYRRLLDEVAASLCYERNGRVYPSGAVSLQRLLGALATAIHRVLAGSEAHFLHQFVTLQLAACDACDRLTWPMSAELDPEQLVILDPEAWIVLEFDFDEILTSLSLGHLPELQLIANVISHRDQVLYLLRPQISRAMPLSELDLLRAFDGLTPVESAVDSLAARLNVSRDAVFSRVAELWRDRVLVLLLRPVLGEQGILEPKAVKAWPAEAELVVAPL